MTVNNKRHVTAYFNSGEEIKQLVDATGREIKSAIS